MFDVFFRQFGIFFFPPFTPKSRFLRNRVLSTSQVLVDSVARLCLFFLTDRCLLNDVRRPRPFALPHPDATPRPCRLTNSCPSVPRFLIQFLSEVVYSFPAKIPRNFPHFQASLSWSSPCNDLVRNSLHHPFRPPAPEVFPHFAFCGIGISLSVETPPLTIHSLKGAPRRTFPRSPPRFSLPMNFFPPPFRNSLFSQHGTTSLPPPFPPPRKSELFDPFFFFDPATPLHDSREHAVFLWCPIPLLAPNVLFPFQPFFVCHHPESPFLPLASCIPPSANPSTNFFLSAPTFSRSIIAKILSPFSCGGFGKNYFPFPLTPMVLLP